MSESIRRQRAAVIAEPLCPASRCFERLALSIASRVGARLRGIADPAPDVAGLVTDDLVVFPWDARVLVGSSWQVHPDIAEAVEKLEGEEPQTDELRPSQLRKLRP